METAHGGRQVAGMDLHRRRSVLVRMTEDGRRLAVARITSSPQELRGQIARAGKCPKVVLAATYGWHWAADTLAAVGAEAHLAHPLGVKAFSYRRVKKMSAMRPILPTCCGWGACPEDCDWGAIVAWALRIAAPPAEVLTWLGTIPHKQGYLDKGNPPVAPRSCLLCGTGLTGIRDSQ